MHTGHDGSAALPTRLIFDQRPNIGIWPTVRQNLRLSPEQEETRERVGYNNCHYDTNPTLWSEVNALLPWQPFGQEVDINCQIPFHLVVATDYVENSSMLARLKNSWKLCLQTLL